MKKVLILLWAMAAIASAQTASVQVDANGTVLNFQSPSTKAVNFPTGKLTVNGVQITGQVDASTTVKGVTRLSVTPVSASNPIAVGDNDSRNTNARTPTTHASTHADGGSDPVTLIISQITGLQSALDLKAPLASPTFTGVPLAPTASVDTNTTQIATTGFVLAQAANATPIVASTGAIGASTRYARQDHVHPAQTSVTGNAATATALQTARTINGTSFDGTGNITVTAAAGTLTGTTLASGVTASSLLSASGGSFGTAAFTASSAYATSSQGVTTLSLATPNVLYTTPVTFSNSSGAWTGTLSLNTQSANTVFAGPTTGSAATPTMRALVLADLPGITSANLRSLLSDENGSGVALFDSATNPTFDGATINNGSLTISGNISSTAWTTNGLRLKGVTGTLTDTTSSGTVAAAYTNKLGGNTIAASSATTFTNYISLYLSDPVAGTNVTITNKFALGADSASFGTSTPFKISNTGAVSGGSGWAASGANTDITSITGSAASLSISGQTGLLTFTGLTSTNRAKTVRDAADTILELGGSYTPTGTWTSLPLTTPKITTGINDANGNSMLAFTPTASAVDGFTFTNAATANPATVTMAATGSDSNINLALTPKGTGVVSSAAQFIGKAGSASSPAFSFTGFTNYGIYAGSGPNRLGFVVNGNEYAVLRGDSGCINVRGTFGYTWAPAGDALASADTGLFRNAAAVVEINNGTAGQWGSLKLGTRDGGTNTITNGLTLGHQSTGTAAAGLGEAILGNLDSSTTADQNAFRLYYKWSDATHATRTSAFGLQLVNSAAALADVLTITGAGNVTITGSLAVNGGSVFGGASGVNTGWYDDGTNLAWRGHTSGSIFLQTVAGAKNYAVLYSTGGVSIGNGGSDPGDTNLSVTGTLSPVGGIVGTTTNNNAAAGNVGQYVSASVVVGSATALTTATPKTVTSISLTAGDWDVTAIGALTGASTGTEFDVAIGTTTNSLTGTVLGDTRCQTPTVSLTGADASLMVPAVRVSISSTTTYYLIVQETFTVGSPAAYGRISARRIR